MALSGTAIKNHAGEYFSVLNMIAPNLFNSKFAFYQNDCATEYKNGIPKPGGLRDPVEFFAKTRNFIMRFERKDVMPELPVCSRSFRYCDLGKEVGIAYEKTIDEFVDYMETTRDSGLALYSNTLAYLSKMRHLTGLAKVDAAIDYCQEFLGSREANNGDAPDKLTIFHHHKDVGYTLHASLSPMLEEIGANPPLMFTGDLDSNTRAEVVKAFKDDPKNRIMICSTLAGGEGLNLQFCHDFVLLERQWNPANEEQAEARFIRIGQLSDKVFGTYIVAVGTIDEFFAELVERKRAIMKQTLDGKNVMWEEQDIIKELGEKIFKAGRSQRWKY
jgi:SNF2 family DNA or RNA helicase